MQRIFFVQGVFVALAVNNFSQFRLRHKIPMGIKIIRQDFLEVFQNALIAKPVSPIHSGIGMLAIDFMLLNTRSY